MAGKKRRKKRGMARQKEKRRMERAIRIQALIFRRWTGGGFGMKPAEAAARLGLALSTLARWQREWEKDRLKLEPRGRPGEPSDVNLRNAIIAIFHLMGPGVSVETLKQEFPDVPRRELEELLDRYRHVYRSKNWQVVHALKWPIPRTVWAMDFAQPPQPVDGQYPYVLAVRDLGSGMTLAAQPLPRKTAEQTFHLLTSLFLEHGAPIVLKSDNDGAFTAPLVTDLLDRHGVFQLLSPPGTPEYNGAIEAGIGAIKYRAHLESARHDHPGQWSSDDLYAAQHQANETPRPWVQDGLAPKQLWGPGNSLEEKEFHECLREDFRRHYERLEPAARIDLRLLPGLDFGPAIQAHIDRTALVRALLALGLLRIRRRRVSPPFKRRVRERIS